uniref:Uncharacterized protein n=1 Tax=Anguilla anguilla TaxID=7936 RepID=A0A0E9QDZ0_ANGAN
MSEAIFEACVSLNARCVQSIVSCNLSPIHDHFNY